MVRWFPAAVLTLLALLILAAACGKDNGKVVQVSITLPEDWESVLDMQALGAPSSSPYIGTIRFLYGDGQSRVRDFPFTGHSAAIDTDGGGITVQALTAGQVIMEGSVPDTKGDVSVALEKVNGFSLAGTLLFPRQNHSAVLVDGDVYLLAGNPDTGVIEAIAPSGDGFVSGAYAASLVYPREDAVVLHDPTGNRFFVFKGASAVDDNLYEIVDLENEMVVPRTLSNLRFNYFPIWDNLNIFLLGGDDGISTWFENTLVINSQNLDEHIWTGISPSVTRNNPECLNDGTRVSCFGGGSDVVEVFNSVSGETEHYLTVFPDNYGFSIAMINSQNIIITGGLEGPTSQNYIKLFQPISGDFSDFGTGLNFPRYFHTSTLISDNLLLIVGGGPTVDSAHSAEILNLTTGQSTLLPWKMRVPRVGHTATLLPDGRVLVAGGSATDRRMEVFYPRLPQ